MLGSLFVNWEPGYAIWSCALSRWILTHFWAYMPKFTCWQSRSQDRPTSCIYKLFLPKMGNYSITFPARETSCSVEYIVFSFGRSHSTESALYILPLYPLSPWQRNPNQGREERLSPSCGLARGRNADGTDPHWSTGHTCPSQRQLRGEINSQMGTFLYSGKEQERPEKAGEWGKQGEQQTIGVGIKTRAFLLCRSGACHWAALQWPCPSTSILPTPPMLETNSERIWFCLGGLPSRRATVARS